jgi:hypothetical protein
MTTALWYAKFQVYISTGIKNGMGSDKMIPISLLPPNGKGQKLYILDLPAVIVSKEDKKRRKISNIKHFFLLISNQTVFFKQIIYTIYRKQTVHKQSKR